MGYVNADIEEVLKAKGIPTVVCLCGSTRFREEYRHINARETLAGKIVTLPGCFKGDPEWGTAAKGELDELHKRKIELAQEVIIINVDGYLGDSTKSELAHAIKERKIIRFAYWDWNERWSLDTRDFLEDVAIRHAIGLSRIDHAVDPYAINCWWNIGQTKNTSLAEQDAGRHVSQPHTSDFIFADGPRESAEHLQVSQEGGEPVFTKTLLGIPLNRLGFEDINILDERVHGYEAVNPAFAPVDNCKHCNNPANHPLHTTFHCPPHHRHDCCKLLQTAKSLDNERHQLQRLVNELEASLDRAVVLGFASSAGETLQSRLHNLVMDWKRLHTYFDRLEYIACQTPDCGRVYIDDYPARTIAIVCPHCRNHDFAAKRGLTADEIRELRKDPTTATSFVEVWKVVPAETDDYRLRWPGGGVTSSGAVVQSVIDPHGGRRRGDSVNHPEHYGGGDNPYEVIKVIEAIPNLKNSFGLGNAFKYIARAGMKGARLEDLQKARWYLDRVIRNEAVNGSDC
jgi:ElaB/YqjD/DUF883 family membrane-anchored ribosome-binding protein